MPPTARALYHGRMTGNHGTATAGGEAYEPVAWREGRLWLLDQTLLPAEERHIPLDTVEAAAEAIDGDARARRAGHRGDRRVRAGRRRRIRAAGRRPRDRRGRRAAAGGDAADGGEPALGARPRGRARGDGGRRRGGAFEAVFEEARAIHDEQREADARMAALGAALFEPGARVLTLCNTGPLATAGGGTALGVIVEGWRTGRVAEVLACETRPRLQGARLTAWELQRHGVPFRLVVEGAAASLMAAGRVDAVVTGADRVAANGDTANKIGTYMLAVLARHHGVPFRIVAPVSTLDPATPDGASIPIEERDEDEVLRAGGADLAAPGARALNPAFDVTPAALIDAIVTERGVLRAPYGPAIAEAVAAARPAVVGAAS